MSSSNTISSQWTPADRTRSGISLTSSVVEVVSRPPCTMSSGARIRDACRSGLRSIIAFAVLWWTAVHKQDGGRLQIPRKEAPHNSLPAVARGEAVLLVFMVGSVGRHAVNEGSAFSANGPAVQTTVSPEEVDGLADGIDGRARAGALLCQGA